MRQLLVVTCILSLVFSCRIFNRSSNADDPSTPPTSENPPTSTEEASDLPLKWESELPKHEFDSSLQDLKYTEVNVPRSKELDYCTTTSDGKTLKTRFKYVYDNEDRLTSFEIFAEDAPDKKASLNVTYKDGRMIKQTMNNPKPSDNRSYEYEYDNQGHLTKWVLSYNGDKTTYLYRYNQQGQLINSSQLEDTPQVWRVIQNSYFNWSKKLLYIESLDAKNTITQRSITRLLDMKADSDGSISSMYYLQGVGRVFNYYETDLDKKERSTVTDCKIQDEILKCTIMENNVKEYYTENTLVKVQSVDYFNQEFTNAVVRGLSYSTSNIQIFSSFDQSLVRFRTQNLVLQTFNSDGSTQYLNHYKYNDQNRTLSVDNSGRNKEEHSYDESGKVLLSFKDRDDTVNCMYR